MNEVRRSDRLRRILRRRGIRRRWEAITALAVVLIATIVPVVVVPRGVRWWQARRDAQLAAERETVRPPAIAFPSQAGRPLTIHADRWAEIDLKLSTVAQAPAPPALKMDGVLYLDPDDYSLVRSRFEGEVVEMPIVTRSSNSPATLASPEHSLRFGDKVTKGQLLAVIWSRELGEKKSELAQALSTLAFDRETLTRLNSNEAAVPVNTIREAERRVRGNEIAVESIEKTLRSWQLSLPEIEQIRTDLLNDSHPASDPQHELNKSRVDRWARVEIRSPIDGTIVEKNITEGTLVSLDDALFKIADLTHLDVRAFAYEEDIATLQRLPAENRQWTIRMKGDLQSPPIQGVFDRIGSLIDPLQHTGIVMGWVDNSEGSMRPGQFVTAAVVLPDPHPLLSVPAEAVVDVDGATFVLVQQEQSEQFLPKQVRVVRFLDGLACVDPRHSDAATEPLRVGQQVITSGAAEIVAEYQLHLKTSSTAVQVGSTLPRVSESGDAP